MYILLLIVRQCPVHYSTVLYRLYSTVQFEVVPDLHEPSKEVSELLVVTTGACQQTELRALSPGYRSQESGVRSQESGVTILYILETTSWRRSSRR